VSIEYLNVWTDVRKCGSFVLSSHGVPKGHVGPKFRERVHCGFYV